MGNNQSNTNTARNYKLFKITRKDVNDNFIRFHLDDYVSYNNGDYKHIDFEKKSFFTRVQFLDYLEGMFVVIDIERTQQESSGHSFRVLRDSGVMRPLQGELPRDSRGNILRGTIEYFGEIAQMRERYAAAAEHSRWVAQTQLSQTSYDLPPKW